MRKNSVVIYKNTCAVTGDGEGEKFEVTWCVSRATASGKKAVYASQKVRPRDVIFLAEDGNLEKSLDFEEEISKDNSEITNQIQEVYELFAEGGEAASEVSLNEIIELARGEIKADEVFGIYKFLKNSLLFEEKIDSTDCDNLKILFIPRSAEKIKELKNKAFEKEHAQELRDAFITRLKQGKLLPEDSKYMQEVEAFALGKTYKCRILADAGFKETIERAHDLLLKNGIWDITRNPYPLRWGLSMKSAQISLSTPPDEKRVKVDGISYAIDSP